MSHLINHELNSKSGKISFLPASLNMSTCIFFSFFHVAPGLASLTHLLPSPCHRSSQRHRGQRGRLFPGQRVSPLARRSPAFVLDVERGFSRRRPRHCFGALQGSRPLRQSHSRHRRRFRLHHFPHLHLGNSAFGRTFLFRCAVASL